MTNLTPEQRAELRALLPADRRPATDQLLTSLAEALRDVAAHQQTDPKAENLFAGNLHGWMGERMAPVLVRLLDAEAVVADQAARIERRRLRLVAAENDLMEMRGHLSPNGQQRRVPMPLGKELAPVVEWLLAENERLTRENDDLTVGCAADDAEPVIA